MACSGTSRTVNFEASADGVSIAAGTYVDNTTLWQSWGLTILGVGMSNVSSGVYSGQTKRLMTFPSQSSTYAGTSVNLINTGGGEGNILMPSLNNQSPVYGQTLNSMRNDTSNSTISFQFTGPVEITQLRMIGNRSNDTANAYSDTSGSTLINTFIVANVNNGVITNYNINNMQFVRRFDVVFGNTGNGVGGIASLTFRSCGACPSGSVPDCNGVCNGPSVQDCAKVCYNPNTTQVANICDCAGVCYARTGQAANIPDCLGVCYPRNSQPPNSEDCFGVCGGNAVYDCLGVCGGGAYRDCSGTCRTNQVSSYRIKSSKRGKF